jgi:hypothetical protein
VTDRAKQSLNINRLAILMLEMFWDLTSIGDELGS